MPDTCPTCGGTREEPRSVVYTLKEWRRCPADEFHNPGPRAAHLPAEQPPTPTPEGSRIGDGEPTDKPERCGGTPGDPNAILPGCDTLGPDCAWNEGHRPCPGCPDCAPDAIVVRLTREEAEALLCPRGAQPDAYYAAVDAIRGVLEGRDDG